MPQGHLTLELWTISHGRVNTSYMVHSRLPSLCGYKIKRMLLNDKFKLFGEKKVWVAWIETDIINF